MRRESLHAQLDRARDLPLTLISAPAGYGKSALAASWVSNCGMPSAWLSLDPDHTEDPHTAMPTSG